MNHLSRFMVSVASLLILAGCSDDFNPDNKGNGVNGGDDAPGVYLGINFKMPGMGGTRSWTDGENTSNNGTEVGSDAENNVN